MGQQAEIYSRYRSLFNSSSVDTFESDTTRKIDNMEFIDFLVQVIRSTKGQKQFKNIILKGSMSELKKTNSISDIIRSSFLKKFSCDNNLIIPAKYTTESSVGAELNKKLMDPYGLLRIDPSSDVGKLMYEGNNSNKHVNYIFYKAQSIGQTQPISFFYKNKELFRVYAKNSGSYDFKFGSYYKNKPYNIWLADYMDAVEPHFNFVNYSTILTDLITGAISLKADKNKSDFREQSRLLKALQKLFGFCSENEESSKPNGSPSDYINNLTLNNKSNTTDNPNPSVNGFGNPNNNSNSLGVSNDPFDFTFTDLEEIDREADLKSKGIVRFYTCDNLDINLDPDNILNDLNQLFDNSKNNNIIDYSNNSAINTSPDPDNGYDNNIKNPNLDKTTDFFSSALKNGVTNLIDDGEDNIVADFPNMFAEMQLNILKAIPYALMQLIISPRLMLIPLTFEIINGGNLNQTSDDLIRSMSSLIKDIGSSITNLLIKNIFDSIKSDIVKLGKDLAASFLKQRGKDYLGTLTSLFGILGLLGGNNNSSCGGVLNKLLKLLKLTNFGPMTPIPPPLILVGGALKPGLNQVSIINDIKASLEEKGIVTAPTLSDGTPNHNMIIMEEIVKTMITHIKQNASISTFALGATGPVTGYAQIQ